MTMRYFTDRESGPRPRISEEIGKPVWGGLYALISARLVDGSFGVRFPNPCPDGYGVVGHDSQMLLLTLGAEIPNIGWPLDPDTIPAASAVLDLLEFVSASIAKPIEGQFHSYFRHHHLDFDRDEGLAKFVSDVNLIFSRNGMAYELTPDGIARRILPDGLRQIVAEFTFRTGDSETDRLLEASRRQVSSPHLDTRRDALEKLWDAFERIKTLEAGNDKRAQADALLDKAAQHKFREMLGTEASALTTIGNTFRIRHAEVTQEVLISTEQVDYLLHRMLSFLRFLLKTTGREG